MFRRKCPRSVTSMNNATNENPWITGLTEQEYVFRHNDSADRCQIDWRLATTQRFLYQVQPGVAPGRLKQYVVPEGSMLPDQGSSLSVIAQQNRKIHKVCLCPNSNTVWIYLNRLAWKGYQTAIKQKFSTHLEICTKIYLYGGITVYPKIVTRIKGEFCLPLK